MLAAGSLPVEDPILVFGIAMVVFLTAPLLLQRYRLPGIIGIILVGALIGENGIAVLERDEAIVLLGEVGLVYLMFIAGLEINVTQLLAKKDRSIVFGIVSFLVPQLVGTGVGYAVLGLSVPAAALFASIFASHTLLAYPVVNTLGITGNESVTTTIGGTIITDTLALLVLAVAVASTEGELGPAFWLELAVGLTLFFVGVWVLVPRIGRWFFRTVERGSYFEFLFVMAVLFLGAHLAEVAGVEPIIGAFLVGLTLNRLIPNRGTLMSRIEFVGNALFIPFFLLSVGMLVDIRVLASGLETITLATALIVLVLVTKLVAAWLTARVYGYSSDETMTMFGLSVGQAAAALAIVLIGTDVGLFDEHMLNAVVLMILVVSVLSPVVVDRYGREVVRAGRTDRPTAINRAQRILIPFQVTDTEDPSRNALLEFALLVRDEDATEPLYVLHVVQAYTSEEYDIEEVDRAFGEIESVSASADVPVSRRTRVDRDVASGIANVALENRISTLLIGWDGSRSGRHHAFGPVIDRVLARTNQLALVAHVRSSIETSESVVVLIPSRVRHNTGFAESIDTIVQTSERLGASVRVIGIGNGTDRLEEWFEDLDSAPTVAFDPVDDWDDALEYVQMETREDRLLLVVSARRGEVGWNPSLETIPTRVSTRVGGNFVVVYPTGSDPVDDRQFFEFE